MTSSSLPAVTHCLANNWHIRCMSLPSLVKVLHGVTSPSTQQWFGTMYTCLLQAGVHAGTMTVQRAMLSISTPPHTATSLGCHGEQAVDRPTMEGGWRGCQAWCRRRCNARRLCLCNAWCLRRCYAWGLCRCNAWCLRRCYAWGLCRRNAWGLCRRNAWGLGTGRRRSSHREWRRGGAVGERRR